MATQSHVPPPPPTGNHPAVGGGHLTTQGGAPKLEAGGYGPTIGVKGMPIDDGERDPDTISEEQRIRSEEMEQMGIEKWIAAHDQRIAGEPQRSVTATVQIESHKAS